MKKSNKVLLIGFLVVVMILVVLVIAARVTLDKQYMIAQLSSVLSNITI